MKESELFKNLFSIIYWFQYNFLKKKKEFFLLDFKNIGTNGAHFSKAFGFLKFSNNKKNFWDVYNLGQFDWSQSNQTVELFQSSIIINSI